MGILRSHTTHHLSQHFLKNNSSTTSSSKEEISRPPTSNPPDPTPGINRSATDPFALNNPSSTNTNPTTTSSTSSIHKTTPPSSRPTSGTSSPARQKSSLDIVRKIRERPSSAIPGYYHVAEEIHKYKMRNCQGMSCTEEETVGIDKMKKWSWKHAGHPGEAVFPVGPMDEEFKLEGVALEQLNPKLKRHHSN